MIMTSSTRRVLALANHHIDRFRQFSSLKDVVDLRSDTVTKPTEAMLQSAYNAELGDDVLGEDPTVKLLQSRMAEIFNKEAALFVPTGTMSNICAIASHAANMSAFGKEIIVGRGSHISVWEQGNVSNLLGVHSRQLPDEPQMKLEDIQAAYRADDDDHYAQTCLVCIENTHNLNGGKSLSKTYIDSVAKLVHDDIDRNKRIPLHIDGARIFNAAESVGIDVATLCNSADSVSVCLSKGLGAPLGSVLVGTDKFIYSAKRARKSLGGGMRQSGVVAAMGLYAVENHVERLSDDHRRAKRLAEELRSNGFLIAHEEAKVDSNLVYFSPCQTAMISQEELIRRLHLEYNIKMGGGYTRQDNSDSTLIRMAVHMGVDDEGIDRTIEALISLCSKV